MTTPAHPSRPQQLAKRSLVAGVVATALVGTLAAGCAPEPVAHTNPDEGKPVIVMVDRDVPHQLVLGSLYNQALTHAGYTSALRTQVAPTFGTRLSWITTGDADVVVVCSGELLTQLSPAKAAELSEEYVADRAAGRIEKNSWDWQERVFTEMAKVLPSMMMATEPSNAQSCEQTTDLELPQNVVPIVRKTKGDKALRTVLNNVSGTVSTSDIHELTNGVLMTGVVTGSVADYLLTHGL